MIDFEWANVVIGALGVVGGAASGIFAGGFRLGRIESRLKLNFQEKLTEHEQRFEDKVDQAIAAFDETLKGLRQKINDVEKDAILRFLPKEEFNDFRIEYREDTREIKAMIRNGHGHK